MYHNESLKLSRLQDIMHLHSGIVFWTKKSVVVKKKEIIYWFATQIGHESEIQKLCIKVALFYGF